jgi:hypothetical protein
MHTRVCVCVCVCLCVSQPATSWVHPEQRTSEVSSGNQGNNLWRQLVRSIMVLKARHDRGR